VVIVAAPAGAGASTISGKVTGAKLPAGKKGVTTVRAVRTKDLVIAGVDEVSKGRFKLKVPAGTYWMFGATAPLRGKNGVDRGGTVVRVRAGKKKTVGVSMRKPKRVRMSVSHAAQFVGFKTVKHPAVWVQHFSAPAEYHQLRRAISWMLISDLIEPLAKACNGVLVEREKLSIILQEQAMQQSPLFDPASRVKLGKITAHNREVSGSLTVVGDTMTLTVVVKNVVTGATRSVSRSAPKDRFFELEASVIQETVRLICGDKPPAAYEGAASGSLSGADGSSSSQTLSWNGTVRLKFTGDVVPENAGDPVGEYALYAPQSGSIHLILDGVQDGDCVYHGEADVTIVPEPMQLSRVQQGVDEPTYSLLANFPADTPPMVVTTTGPQHCSNGTSPYGLAGRVYLGMATGESQRSPSSTLVGTSAFAIGPVTVKWAWSLGPQAN
jgi:hypothetical protein